jgi:putative tryptophan/tyrosine transport system substrate-binding protein
MRRRELVLVLGGLITPAHALRAQQKAMPVIGFLSEAASGPFASYVAAFHQGLNQAGYVAGRNVAIEYRWAEGHYDRLPALAAELVGRKVDVIAAIGGTASGRAAKNATATIPIVIIAGDPVEAGLVANLARPGGNVTGVSIMQVELTSKRIELLSDLIPQPGVIGVLVNQNNPSAERALRVMQETALAKGLQLHTLWAGTENEIDAALATLAELHAGGLVVSSDPFFNSRREHIVAMAAHYTVPAIYEWSEFTKIGGLISYGPSLVAAYRLAGSYTGKVLGGANPASLPVEQPTQFDLVINRKTAQALGLTVPQSILTRADEVIE